MIPQLELEPRDPVWEAACLRYLWLLFNRAPEHHIVDAADVVLKYVVLPGYARRVLH
jgi:hypothetical protein